MSRFRTKLGRRRLRKEEEARTSGRQSVPRWPAYCLLSRVEAEVIAENGDVDARDWVVHHPEATHFGVDDGNIVVRFPSEEGGKEWLRQIGFTAGQDDVGAHET